MALKDIPSNFSVDSEDDLRFAISQYFLELGFESHELSFEDQFTIRLGHNLIEVTRSPKEYELKGRSDLLLTRNGLPLAIVEIKRSTHSITDEDAEQAISYARLLRHIAPYAIVTNGKETRVYDTVAAIPSSLIDPRDADWNQKGKPTLSISDDLRYQAARLLVDVNPDTLKSFCQQQLSRALSDLKGDINESKLYVPEVYIERAPILNEFQTWMSSEIPCFALVADSGIGKTNFLCAIAENLIESNLVLFYPAFRLRNEGLVGAIVNDFAWEFHRNREIVQIVERFDEVLHNHSGKLIIFVDGVDEFPGNREIFKNELIDFVSHLQGRNISLCISCKTFDWSDFVIEREQFFNHLAKLIYPKRDTVHNPSKIDAPDPKQVGVWLSEFTDAELSLAFEKYQLAYSLQGQLQGSVRIECQSPLMLRLISEVYCKGDMELPSTLSKIEVFDLYWKRKIGAIPAKLRVNADQFVSQVAMLCIHLNQRQIDISTLRESLTLSDAMNDAVRHLVRLGLLRSSDDELGISWLSFGYEKLRSYTFTIRAQKWLSKDPAEVANEICEAIGRSTSLTELTRLGLEAVEFYLDAVVDRGETAVITEIARNNFAIFSQLMRSFPLNHPLEQIPAGKQRADAYIQRLDCHASMYSELRRKYFPDLYSRVVPYEQGEVGAWSDSGLQIRQLRLCTDEYPQRVIIVSPEIAGMLFKGNMPDELYAALRPIGAMHLGRDILADVVPQKLAWKDLEKQIIQLLEDRLLDETTAPLLLMDRIWEMLLYQPIIWMKEDEDKVYARFWKFLNFQDIEEVEKSPIQDIRHRTYNLIKEFQDKAVKPKNLDGADTTKRLYGLRLLKIYRLYYWLELLQNSALYLAPPTLSVQHLEQRKSVYDIDWVAETVKLLLPKILSSYRSLVLRNFSQFIDMFLLCRFPTIQIWVEVNVNSFGGFELVYSVLPSRPFIHDYHVSICEPDNCISKLKLTRKTLRGYEIRSDFGQCRITNQVEGKFIDDPNAFIFKTSFSLDAPILDQVYQLLATELQIAFNSDEMSWRNAMRGSPDSNRVDQWIRRHYLSQTMRMQDSNDGDQSN